MLTCLPRVNISFSSVRVENKMFTSNLNKGFSITFDNGNTASIQWGPLNYCEEKKHRHHYDEPMKQDVWSCDSAEIAAWDKNGNWHRFEPDAGDYQVDGHVKSNEVLAFLLFVATKELDTKEDKEDNDEDAARFCDNGGSAGNNPTD
jgi:hypothetical protein